LTQLASASASRRTLLDGIAWNFRQARSKRRDPNLTGIHLNFNSDASHGKL
jgi:hypothetical protein